MSKIKKNKLAVMFSSLAGCVIVAAILIIINMIFTPLNLRLDCTEGKIYTLSNGTAAILKKLDKPVTLRFYYTKDHANMPVYLKTYATRVEDMLREYVRLGGGKLIVKKLNPTPDSDAEDSARLDGINGQSLDTFGAGERMYLGVAVSTAGKTVAMPFLSPEKETQLEYELTRAVSEVMLTAKTRIGVMSSLPVMGGADNPQMMMQPGAMKPAWLLINELKRGFEIIEIPVTSEKIDPNIDVLMVIHPVGLSEKTFFAIDQFVLRGGRLIAFVDPYCIAEMYSRPQQQPMPPRPSEMNALLKAWGIGFDSNKVVVDHALATRIMSGGNAEIMPTVLTITNKKINDDEPAVAELNSLLLFAAGAFSGVPSEGLQKTVLLNSTKEAASVETFLTMGRGEDIMKNFRAEGLAKELAVKLTGDFKTAFPDGIGGGDNGKNSDSKPEEPAQLKKSVKPGAVILVGDADMLYDAFSVQRSNFMGQEILQPFNDNLNFALNLVEYLSGDSALLEVRSRTMKPRPFDRVRDLQVEAEKKFQAQIVRIEDELRKVQQDINALQQKRQESDRELLSSEQRDVLRRFRVKETEAKRELKDVRKQLRRNIDSLENSLMIINIAMMPALVIMTGICVAIVKRRRSK